MGREQSGRAGECLAEAKEAGWESCEGWAR
jgi:hypothetical protein